MADDDVQLTDLEVIQRYSLAVRGATASRAELVRALQADLDWLRGGRGPAAQPEVEPTAAPKPAAGPVKKAVAKKAVRTPAAAPAKTPAKAPAKRPTKA